MRQRSCVSSTRSVLRDSHTLSVRFVLQKSSTRHTLARMRKACVGGVPVYAGEPELLGEHLDGGEALRAAYTEDAAKKFGASGARLYNALRGEAYTAARGEKIDKKTLLTNEVLEKLLDTVSKGVRPQGPTRTGELLKE